MNVKEATGYGEPMQLAKEDLLLTFPLPGEIIQRRTNANIPSLSLSQRRQENKRCSFGILDGSTIQNEVAGKSGTIQATEDDETGCCRNYPPTGHLLLASNPNKIKNFQIILITVTIFTM